MEAVTDNGILTLKHLGDDCFAITKALQEYVEDATVRVGSARFIVGGFEKKVYVEYEGGLFLSIHYRIDAPADTDVSFMCAKAMVYGLYTAARDVMIREHSTAIGATSRVINRNSEASASVTFGNVTITLTLAYGEG